MHNMTLHIYVYIYYYIICSHRKKWIKNKYFNTENDAVKRQHIIGGVIKWNKLIIWPVPTGGNSCFIHCWLFVVFLLILPPTPKKLGPNTSQAATHVKMTVSCRLGEFAGFKLRTNMERYHWAAVNVQKPPCVNFRWLNLLVEKCCFRLYMREHSVKPDYDSHSEISYLIESRPFYVISDVKLLRGWRGEGGLRLIKRDFTFKLRHVSDEWIYRQNWAWSYGWGVRVQWYEASMWIQKTRVGDQGNGNDEIENMIIHT
jgi:hypothetical protein